MTDTTGYAQRVREVAERHARRATGALYADDIIPLYESEAKLTLEITAKAIEQFYKHLYGEKADATQYLIKNGYIKENDGKE